MKRKKTLALVLLTFIVTMFFQVSCVTTSEKKEKKDEILDNLLKDHMRGEIIDTTQSKLSITTGERAVVNLGAKNGIIKGDIYGITTKKDVDLKGPVGECAVQMVYNTESICEIIKLTKEVQKGNVAFINKINYTDQDLYNITMDMLSRIVEPYKPYKKVTVSLYAFFDENNNITEFSETIDRGIRDILSQKGRIRLVSQNISRDTLLYPSEGSFTDLVTLAESFMKANDIDVILGGQYKVVGNNIVIDIYKVDKNFDDVNVQYTMPSKGYSNAIAKIVIPYKPMKQVYAIANIIYKPKYFLPGREERNDIIRMESRNDPFVEVGFTDLNFNIISPADFQVKAGNDIFKYDKPDKANKIILGKGVHNISATFKRQYFQNRSLLYASEHPISKDMVLVVDRSGELNIVITADPNFYVKDNIIFNVYEIKEKERTALKPVKISDKVKIKDTFKY